MTGQEHPYRRGMPQDLQRPPKTSRLAIVAFVLSCLFFVPFMPLVGGILGIAATVRVSARRGQLGGIGLAIAAIPVGFVCFFFIQSLLAAIAIPSFVKYTRMSKSVEGRQAIERIATGARFFYQTERFDDAGNPLPRRFPAGRTGWVPAVPCCNQGQGSRCAGGAAEWDGEPWRALRFAPEGPHYFQVRYDSAGQGPTAWYEAEARADLDCDGRYSSFRIKGRIDQNGDVEADKEILAQDE